ncbi:MAG: PD-(D/E)XK nuclease family protein [Synergistaceae bacterium]|jgi:RecB family exonuclease|nr:PD-(D/E)XK nuclease family protein [Synergistaceae bacterium]
MLPSLSSSDALVDMLGTERGFWGGMPDIWSWSEMYARIVPEGELRRQVDPPDHRLILKYVSDACIKELDARGAHVPGGIRRRWFVDILSEAVRELLLEGVSPDMLLCGPGETGDADLLYRLYSDYLLYLESNGLADNSQIPSLLTGSLRRGLPDCLCGAVICWVGFLSFTGSQLRLVKTLRGLGQRMEFFMPETGIEGFHDISAQLADDVKQIGARNTALITLKAEDAFAQYDRIACELADASCGRGALWESISGLTAQSGRDEILGDIGVLVPRDGLPILSAALSKHGVPYQSRSETPVAETGVIELAKRAWEAYRLDWPTMQTSALLRTAGAGGPGSAAPDGRPGGWRGVYGLPHKPGQQPCFQPEGLAAWQRALADDPGCLSLLERSVAFCAYIDEGGGHTPEGILAALLDLCGEGWEKRLAEEAGHDESVDFAVRALASSRLELEQKLRMISELTPPLGEAGRVRFQGSEAIGFLSDWAAEAVTALPPPYKGAVSIYGSPPPVLVSHKLWIMTDIDPSRYPGSPSEPPLLGGETRERVNRQGDSAAAQRDDASADAGEPVHLPTMHEKREQKEAMFRRLLSLGEAVTLAARAELDSKGRAQGDSPFITSLFEGNPPGGQGWILAGEISGPPGGRAASSGGWARRGRFPRAARHLAGDVRDAQGNGQKLRVRASAIDGLADCPFAYWCGHIAALEPPKDDAGLFDRAFQGNVIHDMWRMIWDVYLAQNRSSSLHSVLMAEWGGMESELEGKYPGLRDQSALAVRAELRDAMTVAAIAQDEAEARAADAGLVREDTLLEHDLGTLELANTSFVGRADRIDIWRGVGAVILDYKLGSADKHKDSLQLAAYAVMLEKAGRPVAGFGYIGHKDGRIRGCWGEAIGNVYKGASRTRDQGPDVQMSLARDCMADIDSIAASGEFAANYDSENCPDCPWMTVCRQAERSGFYDNSDQGSEEDAG